MTAMRRPLLVGTLATAVMTMASMIRGWGENSRLFATMKYEVLVDFPPAETCR